MFREKLKESSRVVESIFGGKLLDLRPLKLLSVDRHRKIKPQFYVRDFYALCIKKFSAMARTKSRVQVMSIARLWVRTGNPSMLLSMLAYGLPFCPINNGLGKSRVKA